MVSNKFRLEVLFMLNDLDSMFSSRFVFLFVSDLLDLVIGIVN